jgi:hypothetical protein
MSGLSITEYFPFKRMKIVEQNVHHEDASSALIYMTPDLRYTPLCHDCGSEATTTHSKGHRRLIRDPINARSLYIPQTHFVRKNRY